MAQNYKDLAYAVLLLERQLESYQKLHEEEIEALWKALAELKRRVLAMASCNAETSPTLENVASTSNTSP